MIPGSDIAGNSIFANGSKGIDIEGQPFSNAFERQSLPAPQLSYAVESPGSTAGSVQVEVGGVVNVAPASHYQSFSIGVTIQVYATLNGVAAGQGQLFLGSVQVTTNDNGFATFTLSNLEVPAGSSTTVTATVSIPFVGVSNTSEFSESIAAGGNANNLYVASVYGLLWNR